VKWFAGHAFAWHAHRRVSHRSRHRALKTRFPFLKLDGFENRPLQRRTDLLTVEAIAGFVQAALDSREAAAPAGK